jgi:archaellum component FlaC
MNGEFCYDSQLKAIEDELYLIERELKQIKIDLNNRNDLCSDILESINKNELVLRSINTNIDVAAGKMLSCLNKSEENEEEI